MKRHQLDFKRVNSFLKPENLWKPASKPRHEGLPLDFDSPDMH